MAFGVTSDGFNRKTLPDIRAELTAELTGIFGDINTNDESVFGQLIGVFSKFAADYWEQLEYTYYSFYPSSASGAALDGVCEMNGIIRLPATKSTVTCQLTGTASTVIPAGSRVANTSGDQFELITGVTLTGSGDEGNFIAVEYGDIPSIGGTVTQIVTPVAGWTAVNNSADGSAGRDEETDAELRQRRISTISILGAATVEAIQGRILQEVDNVTAVTVYTNREDTTDIYGRPPHSVEAVIRGGDPQDIREKLWEVVAAGIKTTGNVSGTITDSNGDTQTVEFSIPTEQYVWVEVTVDSYYNEEIFPVDGEDLIKQYVTEYGEDFEMGRDLILDRWIVPIYSNIDGIAGLTIRHAVTALPGDTPTYGTSNIAIGPSSIANMNINRVIVYLP